jgi:hypothetical protein
MPFAPAAAMLHRFTGVRISAATARRQTEIVGRTAEALEEREVARIEDELPPTPPGPARALLSVDGAVVPLRQGEWAETKTLVVGEVAAPEAPEALGEAGVPDPPREVRTHTLSYFSRLADAETFGRLALGEMQRRGVENAGQVAAVSDGAEWIQGFVDLHCPHARRILDFAHAAERVAALGEALAPGDPTWLPIQRHRLKHAGPEPLLADLRPQVAAHPSAAPLHEHLSSLDKRLAQLQYPRFQTDGWPIGSGVVESANQLVVEARLKGAGMRLRASQRQSAARLAQRRLQRPLGRDLGGQQCRSPPASAPALSAAPRASAPGSRPTGSSHASASSASQGPSLASLSHLLTCKTLTHTRQVLYATGGEHQARRKPLTALSSRVSRVSARCGRGQARFARLRSRRRGGCGLRHTRRRKYLPKSRLRPGPGGDRPPRVPSSLSHLFGKA